MKKFILSILATSLISIPSMANYYRFWRGFQKPEITTESFYNTLATRFMPMTLKAGAGKGLTAYLPSVPPLEKPNYIPDEIALVVYESEEKYRAIRATPEGQQYADMHWEVFNRDNSLSAVPIALNSDETLQPNIAYDLRNKKIDWQTGHTVAFIGTRKSSMPEADFLPRLTKHVRLAAQNMGRMDGYLMLATTNYEIAYLHWPSESAMSEDFATPEGQATANDTADCLDAIMWLTAQEFAGKVQENNLYNLRFQP